ncbi:high affinity nitrate transporter NrtB [Emericellopsis atlantica]|uniref:Nitrate/nitrite transporter n=1 Tax=Emericellopsis atlantica TaxID=2614577 RepID=A0A9P7ZUC5_9HYPO|nr:high affinity nitrate transporter NrtB [Emericellopsis atlantica]KAG9257927.1 high affinity nitrate transporter NrtB [Emericellopsis atlantica]
MFDIRVLWKAPELNPINKKAKSVPVLNPFNVYGRVFLFSWLGFMIAFWAWYTFPPLLTETIAKDLDLTPVQVANSNIVSLVSTFFLRFVAGPLCDQFGSRNVYASLLLLGCLPIGLAPLVKDATGLYVSRFFIGVLGATFVPCQVWCTGFFDKNVVGTANAFAGGFGNAGGGLTYVIMPAVFDALVHTHGMSEHKAWRVTFVVPLICLIACGVSMFLLCPETPLGRWNERAQRVQENLAAFDLSDASVVDVPGHITDRPSPSLVSSSSPKDEEKGDMSSRDIQTLTRNGSFSKEEAQATAQAEVVVKPSFKEMMAVLCSLQTLFHLTTYACSFGGELAINSILSSYYKKNFPHFDQTLAGNYASIFGFLNFVTRPLGGIIADVLYTRFGRNLWLKKGWITMCGLLTGGLLILIGQVDPSEANGSSIGLMVGLISLMAIFLEAGNGANFALVPHVHPHANGILSGATGGGGNLGGVVFAIIFRFMHKGSDYAMGLWVIGIIQVALNLAVCWIPPIPSGQVGGR